MFSAPSNISLPLPIICNNQSSWSIDKSKSSIQTPNEFSINGFTLYCLSQKFNDTLVPTAVFPIGDGLDIVDSLKAKLPTV